MRNTSPLYICVCVIYAIEKRENKVFREWFYLLKYIQFIIKKGEIVESSIISNDNTIGKETGFFQCAFLFG